MFLSQRYVTLEDTIRRMAPETPGVYALFNEHGILIFYGSSDNIRSAVLDHKKGKISVCTWSAWYFSFEECTDPMNREKALLEEYQRKHSRLPHCNEALV